MNKQMFAERLRRFYADNYEHLNPAFPSVDDFISCLSEGLETNGKWDNGEAAKVAASLQLRLVKALFTAKQRQLRREMR